HDLSSVLSFFFSSRRRHTICYRDWSSDVCSSDLVIIAIALHARRVGHAPRRRRKRIHSLGRRSTIVGFPPSAVPNFAKSLTVVRSEERRVGKECRSGW